MRIRDRIILDGFVQLKEMEGRLDGSVLRQAIQLATPFLIDNVCDLVEERGGVAFEDVPNAAPPSDLMWFEGHMGEMRFGELLIATPEPFPADRIVNVRKSLWEQPARWWLHGYGFLDQGIIIGPTYLCLGAVGSQGEPLRDSSGWVACLVPYGREWQNQVESAAVTAFSMCLFAISFMHCRNVRRRQWDERPVRQERRRIQRAGLAPTRFEVLQIGPMREVLEKEGRAISNGLKRALHLCRGHFMTFTEEHPAFGWLTGRIWCPLHARGTAKAGTVIKEYEVVPQPKEESADAQVGEARQGDQEEISFAE